MWKKLIEWSASEYGHLPWRKKRSLYGTLVSEIMLQQTTVSTVLNHFERFLEIYPNLKTLAVATEEEVCANWQGLGYYRRARNLHKAAVYLVKNHNGNFPKSIEELKLIPGIGDYTANAIVGIGCDKKALAIDANIERVVARIHLLQKEKGPKLQKDIATRFINNELTLPFDKFSARKINEALMDLGRVYCQARRADCHLCPVSKQCDVFKKNESPLSIPHVSADKQMKKKESHDLSLLRVVVVSKGKILGMEREERQWLQGQIEVPTFILKSGDRSLKQYPKIKMPEKEFKDLPLLKTAITKYKIKNFILTLGRKEFQALVRDYKGLPPYKYYNLDGQSAHFSTTTLKVLNKLSIEV